MSVSRRSFFKLIAAAGVVAFVPIPAIEEAVAALAPKPETFTLLKNSLWRVVGTELAIHGDSVPTYRMKLLRGSDGALCDISMHVDGAPKVGIGDIVQMEVRYEGRVAVVDVEGQELNDCITEISIEFPPQPAYADLIVGAAERAGTKICWGAA